MKNLEGKVKERLDSVGKTQTELARELGMSYYGLSKMLKRGTFKTDYVTRMAKFLNVDINFFGLNSKEGSDNNTVQSGDGGITEDYETKVEYLKQVIATKDEVIKAKDELIDTLKEKLKK